MVKIANGTYSVDSLTGAERSYQVDPTQGTCTCPHFVTRLAGTGKACKHLVMVRAALEAPPTETALQRAQRTAEGLSDAELLTWAKTYAEGPVACACRITLAQRKLQRQEKPIPAAVLVMLHDASPEERERCMNIYR